MHIRTRRECTYLLILYLGRYSQINIIWNSRANWNPNGPLWENHCWQISIFGMFLRSLNFSFLGVFLGLSNFVLLTLCSSFCPYVYSWITNDHYDLAVKKDIYILKWCLYFASRQSVFGNLNYYDCVRGNLKSFVSLQKDSLVKPARKINRKQSSQKARRPLRNRQGFGAQNFKRRNFYRRALTARIALVKWYVLGSAFSFVFYWPANEEQGL